MIVSLSVKGILQANSSSDSGKKASSIGAHPFCLSFRCGHVMEVSKCFFLLWTKNEFEFFLLPIRFLSAP